MQPWREFRAALVLLLAIGIGCVPTQALVTLNFNDGHDHVYVTATLGATHDSNVTASNGGQGDFIYSTGLQAAYTRRAGWIGVNANIAVNSSRFATLKGEDFSNPSFDLEFTKQGGRTTGSLTLSAARESRADSALNVRTTSWNYSAGLNVAYPVVDRFKLAGQFGYSASKYVDAANLVNLSTYTAGLNMFYVYNTERDLSAGYRYRYTQASVSTSSTDHNFSVGMSGRLIRGLSGAVNIGYQFRMPHGGVNQTRSSGLSASGATTYAINRKISLTGQISKDFTTTATDASVDTMAADLSSSYAFNSHWSLGAGTGWGESKFLGQGGRVIVAVGPPEVLGPNRQDTFAHWEASVNYAHNEHFKVTFSYGWFRNWSTVPYADFVRASWNVKLNSQL